jgi:DNA-binding NarL/FixJ family response regulator
MNPFIAYVEDDLELYQLTVKLIHFYKPNWQIKHYLSAEAFEQEAANQAFDIVLMDIGLKGKSGIDSVAWCQKNCPKLPIIMCTSHDNAQMGFDARNAGAVGYYIKGDPTSQLIETIEKVMHNNASANKSVAHIETYPNLTLLTQQEQKVMLALKDALKYEQIAQKHFVSINTIRTHAKNIYHKLGVNSRTEAINKVFGSDFG